MKEGVNMLSAKELSSAYITWLTENIEFNNLEENVVRIDTPFYDRHSDSLILYALIEKESGPLVLTDGGYTMDDLEGDGIFINRSQRKKVVLLETLNSYGVKLNEETNALYINSAKNIFPQDKHRLLQAMLFVNDMFLTSKQNTKNFFLEDVAGYLEENNIRAVTGASFVGSSGMNHKFEFSIAGIKDIPDKLIKVLSSPKNDTYAKALVTDVIQTRTAIKKPTLFYTFINDTENEANETTLNLLKQADIIPIPFRKRNDYTKELAK